MNEEVTIKWQTGIPFHRGTYLVTNKYHQVDTDVFDGRKWVSYAETDVMAWCLMETIKAYNG